LPGIDPHALAQMFQRQSGGILDMFNMFSGGALQRMTIFALNIMPYVSASIIVQVMTIVSPQLEALKKEGEAGRKKMTQYTRYLTVFSPACRPMAWPRQLAERRRGYRSGRDVSSPPRSSP
jgi:preprotein translocase subunit SecY